MAKIIGASNVIDPLYIVAVQLNTLIADGTATSIVMIENTRLRYSPCPARNMWWPHTRKPITAMPTLLQATALYPKMFLRLKQVMTSLITPIPGRIMMYTAGCE